MIFYDGTSSIENLTSFRYFASGTCRYFLNSWHVGCCAKLASKGCGRSWPYNDTYKDSQLNCTIFGHVCWTFFYLVFLNQNCTVFDICDTNAMTVLIRGSRELLCWWYFTNSFRLQTVGFPFPSWCPRTTSDRAANYSSSRCDIFPGFFSSRNFKTSML